MTPIVKDPDLRGMLFNLHFEGISDRFSCFFLQNLDLTNGHLPKIPEKDPPGLLKRMGVTSPHRWKEKAPVPEFLPLQDSITWKDLGELLNQHDDRARIRECAWDPIWSTYSAAQDLFCQFTYYYWFNLTDDTCQPLPGVPASLEQAMKAWSLRSVEKRLNNHLYSVRLFPSVDQLENNIPPKSRDQCFLLKREIFFPEPDSIPIEDIKNTRWKNFYTKGYIKEYHEVIKKSSDGGKHLKDALDGIFENLQILPHNPGRPADVKGLWLF